MPRMLQNWLKTYLDFVAETEAPENYRYWAGISAIASTLKRRVFIKRGAHLVIYPNQYIVLVGPPGIGKGVAMNPATGLVKEANTANYIEDRATAESIQEALANGFHAAKNVGATPQSGFIMGMEHSATGLAPELSVFLGASEWSTQFMCSLWDKNEFNYQTKNKGSSTIKNNCFSLLGACTPSYIRDLNKDKIQAINGGFTARTIFVFANKKGKSIAWPDTDPSSLKDPLVNDLRHIAGLTGEFSFEKGAKDSFIDFYNKNDAGGGEFDSEVLTNFRARMVSHVLKVSMVLAIVEEDDLIIRESHMKESIRLCREIFATLDITFRGVGESDLAEATNRVMSFIETKGICTRPEIVRANYRHITEEDLTRILITLRTMDFCFESTVGRTTQYQYNPQWEK